MYIEMSVQLKGKHLFWTDPRSGMDLANAERLFHIMSCAFPKHKGYRVRATLWESGSAEDRTAYMEGCRSQFEIRSKAILKRAPRQTRLKRAKC